MFGLQERSLTVTIIQRLLKQNPSSARRWNTVPNKKGLD